jgi:dimethylaniline monooxygenase (N-oxide forming)
MSYDIAIIGAGISGLVAAKSLVEQGLRPIILERSNRIGGLWNYGKEGGSPLYNSLKTNISKQMMGLSDFPFPDDYPDFPTHQQVIQYVRSYAKKYDLEKLISYGQEVVKVTVEEGGFLIHTKTASYQVRQLIVSTGRFDVPNVPAIQGRESFTGTVIHSKEYDAPSQFKGKDILIVGAAASAMDIASELYEVAKSVNLSVQHLPWVIPPVINGKPADHALTWLKAKLPKKIREIGFKKTLLNEYFRRGADKNPNAWAFKTPELDLDKTRLVPNEKMIPLLIQQKVRIYSRIRSLEGNTITFSDGETVKADVIIFATGYQTQFPFLDDIIQVKGNYLGLYKHVFHPDYSNLAFVGMANIVGAAFPLVEMQSRLIAAVFAKKHQLPTPDAMKREIEAHKAMCDKLDRDPMRVQALSYLDEIARMIGASPNLMSNTDVLKELMFGPLTAFRFRLNESAGKSKEAKANMKKSVLD